MVGRSLTGVQFWVTVVERCRCEVFRYGSVEGTCYWYVTRFELKKIIVHTQWTVIFIVGSWKWLLSELHDICTKLHGRFGMRTCVLECFVVSFVPSRHAISSGEVLSMKNGSVHWYIFYTNILTTFLYIFFKSIWPFIRILSNLFEILWDWSEHSSLFNKTYDTNNLLIFLLKLQGGIEANV